MINNDKNNTVSAILPNYNYLIYLPSRIDQILGQTHQISELIILDDASTDGSQDYIKEKVEEVKTSRPDLKVITVFNAKNSGNVFSQWQKGIKLATSDYIWIAELDDIAKPELVKTALKHFDDDTALVCTGSRFINENGKPVLKDNLRKIKDAFRKNILVYNTIPNVSAVVFKNNPNLYTFLEDAKKYHLSGDWYFYVRISELGEIIYLNKVLNYHRLHKKSITKTTDFKKRLAEMHSIHQYIINSGLADTKTKNAIKNIEQKLRGSWGI